MIVWRPAAALLAVVALGLAARPPVALAGAIERAAPLRIGDPFPALAGRSLSGTALTISAKSIVVFSFSRAAGRDAQAWDERIAAEPHGFAADLVSELESVPGIMRGLVEAAIRRSVPPAQRDRMLVLTRDETLWRQRLAVTAPDNAYVVVVGASGRVAWLGRGPCSDREFAELEEVLR